MAKKQSNAQQKQHQTLGFRTSDHFKGFTFNQQRRPMPQSNKGFNPATFKTQHKG